VANETPEYRITERFGDVEIREYQPYIVAETIVEGDLENAGNEGFRILASYIFGANRGKRKIEMTAPVQQERPGTQIAMTTPVTQRPRGEDFAIQFMMPSEYALDELPTPDDPRVHLREVPARTLAAIRYSGRWTKGRYQAHLTALVEQLRDAGYEPEGEPMWARYDPPFKPWFLRRNEILTAFGPSSR